MSSGIIHRCCPCCEVDSCLYGDTIDTGCCIGCEDLIMWSERPGFSITHRNFLKSQLTCYPGNINTCPNSEEILALGSKYNCFPKEGCGDPCDTSCYEESSCPSVGCDENKDGVVDRVGKIQNYTIYADTLMPVETIYRFYRTYWRPNNFYSGTYPVHQQVNTHTKVLISELPIQEDPIKDGEYISPKFSRCKYETIDDSPKMYWWQPTYLRTYLKTCLIQESPCADSSCGNGIRSNCTPQEEEKNYCDSNFILDPDEDIISFDLKNGYANFSNQEFSGNNCCYPICADPPCNQVTNFPFCDCDSFWMTRYRRRKLLDDYRYTWGADIECYNDHNYEGRSNAYSFDPSGHSRNYTQSFDNELAKLKSVGNNFYQPSYQQDAKAFRLSDHWLFNMTYERWWKIAKDENGISQVYWDTPGTSGENPNPSVGDSEYPYQVDDLVPKWWIYGCSSVPFFQFELEDAYNPMNSQSTTPRPKISDPDEQLKDLFELCRQEGQYIQPYAEWKLQELWAKLGNLGYFEAKDWREEQLLAYKELHERFPNAGYGAYASKTATEMPLLGPFRKKYYANHSLEMRKPFLRPDLVPKSALPLQAECFIQYPGLFPTEEMDEEGRQQAIDDYYFWAERQWVYFRGVPAGWTWGSWNSPTTCPCNSETFCGVGWGTPGEAGVPEPYWEDAALLAGCGRAAGNCIESWFNAPQQVYAQDNPDNYVCYSYDGPGCVECLDNCNSGGSCDDPESQACEACIEGCYSLVCRVEHKVPQCLVTGGIKQTQEDTSGTSFECKDISCLNCCAACAKEDITNYSIIITSIFKIDSNKFRIRYEPDPNPPQFGGEESTEGDFTPESGDSVTFQVFHIQSSDQDGDGNFDDPTGLDFFNNGSTSFEIVDVGDNYFDVLSSSDIASGFPEYLIANYDFTGSYIENNLGDGTIKRVTSYYCDEEEYLADEFDPNGIKYNCEQYKAIIEGIKECETTSSSSSLQNCGCAATPLIGCPEGICRKLSVTAYCQGVHIIATQYASANKLEWGRADCAPISSPLESSLSYYSCLWSAHTFLTTVQNFYKFSQTLNECITSSDMSMKSLWPEVKNSHIIPQKSMCNPHYAAINGCSTFNDEQYEQLDACDGGICWPWYAKSVCCDDELNCPPNPSGQVGTDRYIYCLQRIACVSPAHGEIWPESKQCPKSNTERDDFLGYTPECQD